MAEAQLSLQLEAEERTGTVTRLVAEVTKAREDDAWEAAKAAAGVTDGPR